MKWVLANQSSTAINKYQLTEGDAIKLELKYNVSQQSVRISSEESHRLFFIDKTGLWHNRTIIKNEYGVETGRLSFDKLHQTGSIEVEGKKYHYTIRQKERPQLVLFEHTISMPLAVCDLSQAPSFTSLKTTQYSSEECACLLLGLCWYLFPLTTSEKLEYALV